MTSTKPTDPYSPYSWQRLSPWALVFLIVRGIQRFVRQNLALILGAGAGFALLDWLGLRELIVAAILVMVIVTLSAVVFHRRFCFRLEENAIRVRRGVIERKELRIRFERVQNVSLSQPLYLRPFGLVRFSLETAGGQQQEVELPGIPRPLAEAMRERMARMADLGHPADVAESTDAATSPPAVLYRATPRNLFLHGLASNQIWLLLGALGSVIAMAERQMERWWEHVPAPQIPVLDTWLDGYLLLLLLAGGVLGGLLVLLLLSGVVVVLRFYGYELVHIEDRFRARFGLLDVREQTLREKKLQGLTLVQTAVGRLLQRWHLVGHQTGGSDVQSTAAERRFMVPGLDWRSVGTVTRQIQPLAVSWPELTPIEPAFRRFFWIRLTALLILLVIGLYMTGNPPAWFVLIVPLMLLPFWAAVYFRWCWWGWAVVDRLLWVRRGFLGQRLDVFALDRVQQVQIRQNPYQRRRGLADLVLILPHGPMKVPFLKLEEVRKLANLVLYRVETATSHFV